MPIVQLVDEPLEIEMYSGLSEADRADLTEALSRLLKLRQRWQEFKDAAEPSTA